MPNDAGKAALYLRSREEFRDQAATAFVSTRREVAHLMSAANEVVAESCLFCSEKDFAQIPAGEYLSGLLVSFCRSHFLLADLIRHGELVDAGVILRKQMELVSRLHELRSGGDVDAFIGKTPNVRHLRGDLRRMYGEYSEIAHSSHPRSLMLLGRITKDDKTFTPFYPVFDENAYVTVSHLCFLIVEFALWTSQFYEDCFPDDVLSDDRLREFWLAFVDFMRISAPEEKQSEDSAGLHSVEAPVTLSRFVLGPCWASEGISGRAVFLALAALFELRSSNAAVLAQERLATEQGTETSSEPSVEQRLNTLAVALAYQHAIGCVNFVGTSMQDELTGKQTVDLAFRDWLAQSGITKPIAALETQAAEEIRKLEAAYLQGKS